METINKALMRLESALNALEARLPQQNHPDFPPELLLQDVNQAISALKSALNR